MPISHDPQKRIYEGHVDKPCAPEKHQWANVRNTAHTIYERCAACGKRRASQPVRAQRGFQQKIDLRWVETGEWSPNTPMPQHRPGAPKQKH